METATDSVFSTLAAALRARLEVIGDRALYARDSAGHLRRLQEVSAEIAAAQAALPPPLDPQLAHYLQRQSYDKALAWIEEHLRG